MGGFVLASIRESENLRSVKQNGIYRILCLGESTTYLQYPQSPEKILNQRDIGIRFEVIDKGKVATTTIAILKELEADLDKYHPQMVVTMMGINDKGIRCYEGIAESDAWIFRHCRAYRFFRILWMNFSRQFRRENIERTKGAGLKPESILNHEEGVAGGESRSVKRSTNGVLESVSEGGKHSGYPEEGRTFYEQGKLSPAANAFEKAIEPDPRNDEAFMGLGRVFFKQKKFTRAKKSFAKALTLDPENSDAYMKLGWCCLARREFSEGETFFKKALELDPRNGDDLAGLERLAAFRASYLRR